MGVEERRNHWEEIYRTKNSKEVSWYQDQPEISLEIIQKLNLNKEAHIIDVGGGDSKLVANLLNLGFIHITVLDISSLAIEKAKKNLGKQAELVNWVVSDITSFKTSEKFDVWHDRAAFHFLTKKSDIESYEELVNNNIQSNGFFILGTFSENGPQKCSGIPIKQYSEEDMVSTFHHDFEKYFCLKHNHKTPFNTVQNFQFCCFKKK